MDGHHGAAGGSVPGASWWSARQTKLTTPTAPGTLDGLFFPVRRLPSTLPPNPTSCCGPLDVILSGTSSSATYTDMDHHDDRPLIIGTLVREFKVVGGTDGGEAGTRTAVTVDFNPIRFLEQ